MSGSGLPRLAARADLCRLLAACFYEPGPEFAEEKVFDALARAAATVDPRLAAPAAALGQAFTAEPLDRLRVDYTALFLHPTQPRALPYESSWLGRADPALRQQAMEDVIRFYAKHGFEVAEDFRDLPDHVAAELEFVYVLLFREASALNAGDGDARADAAAVRRAFLDRHLGRWIEPFAAAMRDGAETPFYRSVARLAAEFIASERA